MHTLRYSLAPMEGVTDSVYRQIVHRTFTPFDRYYTPFLTPTRERLITARQWREIDPARNAGLDVTPQLLTNDPALFCWAAGVLADLGYREVNLNLGCPSGTVVKKKRGSGLLGDPELLERLLDGIFENPPLPVSIKTRLGLRSEEEFGPLLELFDRYPVCELIIHPRVRTDQYLGPIRMDAFARAIESSRAPVCYNGDLFCPADVEALKARFPALGAVMLGRGAVANPGLIGFLRDGTWASKEKLRAFHDALYAEYRVLMPGFNPTVARMREFWAFWGAMFDAPAKFIKRIRKATDFSGYEQAVSDLFSECEFIPDGMYCP